MQLLIDFYKNLQRLGPGGENETKLALNLAGYNETALQDKKLSLKIADIGCGTGSSTLTLLHELLPLQAIADVQITAVDFLEDFLQSLQDRAQKEGVEKHISSLCTGMENLPFTSEEFDILWSEGAIYSMGFAAGVKAWRPFLKENGVLVASEITWLTASRPQKIQEFWDNAYPEMATAQEKVHVLEEAGYALQGYFVLPSHCWIENYYKELRGNFEPFLQAQGQSDEAKALVQELENEIALYQEYQSYYGYGMYIAKKIS